MIIYMTKFPNGKMYIGKTIYDLETRKSQHKYDMKRDKNNKAFYNAIKKYGWDELTWNIIDIAEIEEELLLKEIYWIKYFNTYIHSKNSMGYNSTIGGDGTSGYKFTKEQKEHLLIVNSGENNGFYGKNHSEETKEKQSQAKIGKYEGTDNPNYNNKWNEEQKQNISKLNKGKLIGKNNPAVIITEDIAKDIKVRLSKGEKTKSIVEYLGVTNDVVNNIKMLRAWKDLLPELNALIEKNKQKTPQRINNEIAIEIKIALSKGINIKDIVLNLNVTKDIVNNIRYLKTFKDIMPELNNKLK